MKLALIVGLRNEQGEEETVEMDSYVLLSVLHTVTKPEGFAFEVMTKTDPEIVKPEDYEQACKELGMLFGFIDNVLKSEISDERKEQIKKLN